MALAPKRIPFFPLFPPWWNLFLPLSLCATASFGYKIFFFPRPLYFSRKIHRQNVFFVPSLNYAAFFRASSPPLNFICPRHNFMLIRRCSPFFHPFEIGAVKTPFGIIFQILLHVRSQNHVVSHKKTHAHGGRRRKEGKCACEHCVCVCVWRETSNQGPSSWWWRWYRPPLSSFFLYRFSPPAQTWRLPLPSSSSVPEIALAACGYYSPPNGDST